MRGMKKTARSILWAFTISWFACAGSEPADEVQEAFLVVEPSTLDLARWQVGELRAEVHDGTGRPLPNVPVHWRARDPEIASVDAVGKVQGVAPGETILVAQAAGREVQVPVSVREAALTEIVLVPAVRVVEGASQALEVAVLDERGVRYPDLAIEWEVEDPTVAVVAEDGTVTGIARGKTTTVIASMGELSATTEVQVISPLFYLDVDPARLEVLQGKIGRLAGIPRDARLREVAERPLRWSTSDPAVVSVNDEGLVEGRAEGHAIVWVEGEGKRNYSLVDVLPRATKLDLRVSPTALREGGRANLRAYAYDDQGRTYPGLSFTWTSSDPTVAEVFGGQVVLANRVGTATLTAEQEEHGLRQSVTIQVKQGGKLVLTGAGPGPREAGGTYQLGMGFLQEDGTVIPAENPTFHSYDESVAIVDARGRARIVGVGRATIRIEAEGHTLSADRLAVVRSRELALGQQTTCGLSRNGSAWCWGRILVDRSGEFRGTVNWMPELAAEGLVSIRSGWGTCIDLLLAGPHCDVTYGLTEAGEVIAWALGAPPTRVETGGPPYVAFDTSEAGICGVTSEGRLHCTGEPASSDGVAGVLTGLDGRCTLTAAGEVSCRGRGAFDVDLSGHPIPPREGPFPLSITETHGCAIAEDGPTLCWGENEKGQLGLPPDALWHDPVALPRKMRSVATRPGLTLFVDQEGALGSMGQALERRLSQPDPRGLDPRYDMEAELSNYVPPAPLASVFVGPEGHRCALTEEGRALCWGTNDKGQAGTMPKTKPFTGAVLPVLFPVSPYPEL
jgi:uncharacterized protein YjdB